MFSSSIHGERMVGGRFAIYIVRLYFDNTQVRPGWWRFSLAAARRKGEREAARANLLYGRRAR